MDELRRQLKTDARRFLHSRYAEAAGGMLLSVCVLCFCLFVLFTLNYGFGLTDDRTLFTLPSVFGQLCPQDGANPCPGACILGAGVVLLLLFAAPLRAGRAYWYLENSRGNLLPAAFPFTNLRVFARALYVSLYEVLLRLISVLPVVLPVWFGKLGIRAGTAYFGWDHLTCRLFLLALWLSGCFLLMLWLWFVQRWALLPYLALERPELGLRALLRISRRATKGLRFELLYARLSFLGWALLTVLIFPALFTVPYYEQTMALYARYLLEQAGETRADHTSAGNEDGGDVEDIVPDGIFAPDAAPSADADPSHDPVPSPDASPSTDGAPSLPGPQLNP